MFFLQRRAREARLDVGVLIVVRELAGDFLILAVCVCAQPLGALGGVLLAQGAGVKAQLFGSRYTVRLGIGKRFDSSCQSSFFLKRPNVGH